MSSLGSLSWAPTLLTIRSKFLTPCNSELAERMGGGGEVQTSMSSHEFMKILQEKELQRWT